MPTPTRSAFSSILVLLLAAGSLGAGSVAAAKPKRLNVLLLFADDQRADTIGAWGNPQIRTPNLDRLAARGFSFRRNYCFGSNSGAVCVPSRAMLNTGKNWFRTDAQMTGQKLLPETLREAGYTTFGTGKWHNGKVSYRGFDSARSVFFGGMDDHTRTHLEDLEGGRWVRPRRAEKFSSEVFADTAVEFLKSRKGSDQPFYCYVAFTAPHDPRQPPEEYREEYYRKRPPLPANYLPQHPFDNGQMVLRDEFLLPWPRPRRLLSDQIAEYYGLVTHLDEQVGRVLKALEETGQAENTLVIYTADHGLALGSHGLLGKQSVYEHSMRSPLIISGPGVPRGRSSEAMTYLLDLYPTVCDAAKIAPPTNLDGESLQPLWKGRKKQVRDSIFLPFQNLMRAVHDGRWKLIRYPQVDVTQLFDLTTDPDEMQNLADDPAQADRIRKLTALMQDWQRRSGDTQSLTVANPKPKELNLTGRARECDQWQPAWIRKKYFGLD